MSVSGESPPGEKGKPVASGRRRHGRRKANQALSYTPRAGKQPCPQNNDDFLSEVLTSVIEFGGKKVLEDPFLRKFAEKCAEEHGSSISGITESASGEPSGASTRTENTSAATESERPRQGATVKDSQAPSQTIDQEFDQEPVLVPVRDIFPAPENAEIYNAISPDDPGVIALARSIKERGILDPPLVSKDGFIISGHRRRVAAQMAGLEKIPVRYHRLTRDENPEFTKLLVEANSQRIKDSPTLIRESMVRIDPKAAHQQIINERNEKEFTRRASDLSVINPSDDGRRCEISIAKRPFLDAVMRVLGGQRAYWPLSDRQIHYRLLGPDAPLTHSSKPDSQYHNDKPSYRKLTDLLARARIDGFIPWEAIDDETRPVDRHAAFWNNAQFFRQQFDNFLKGYWRNRQQSQRHHIEIVAEKLTVRSILQQVAQEHTIPLTISRGMSSLPPKKAIVSRYRRSGKEKLILLVVSDLDPAGDAIAEDLVKSFRRDFRIYCIEAYKVALTIEQVEQFDLEPSMEAKDTSPTYRRFVDKYSITDAYELEAFDPADLAQTLQEAIKDVLDADAYNNELTAEETDSAQIVAVRQQVEEFFKGLNLDSSDRGAQ